MSAVVPVGDGSYKLVGRRDVHKELADAHLRLRVFEQAVESELDEGMLETARQIVRKLRSGIHNDDTRLGAADLLDQLLEQVARLAVVTDSQQDKIVKAQDTIDQLTNSRNEYKVWYDEAVGASNEYGYAGMSAAEVVISMGQELADLKAAQVTPAKQTYNEQVEQVGIAYNKSQPWLSAASIDVEIEAKAEEIYNTWSEQEGFVPWVPRGNSTMQDKARRKARMNFNALALENGGQV